MKMFDSLLLSIPLIIYPTIDRDSSFYRINLFKKLSVNSEINIKIRDDLDFRNKPNPKIYFLYEQRF